jgi:predicted CXXCH cytochrome family protein
MIGPWLRSGWAAALLVAAASTSQAGGAGSCVSTDCHSGLFPEAEHSHRLETEHGCGACHLKREEGHPGGEGPEFLLAGGPSERHCLACHGRFANRLAAASRVHLPVQEGRCGDCHDPHAGFGHRFLKRTGWVWDGGGVRFSASLCWQCHSGERIQSEDPGGNTGFREGRRNLHRLHLISFREEGRARIATCTACHDPHASAQPMLVPESVPFGREWTLPFLYSRTPAGGTCRTGCHPTRSYRRD